MARFLSPEWFDEQAGADPDPVLLTIQQVVSGGPEGDRRYVVLVGTTGSSVRLGDAASPDVTFTESWETALAIHEGELAPQRAFADGRLRIEGDVRRLPEVLGRLAGSAE